MNSNTISPIAEPMSERESLPIAESHPHLRSEAHPAPKKKSVSKRKSAHHYIAMVVIAGAALAGGYYYLRFVAPYESTDDAFIEGRVTPVAPQVSGRIVELRAQDNQEVSRGEVLLQIDPSDYEARLGQCQANLTAAKSRLQQAAADLQVNRARVEQERSNVTAAEAEAARAQADYKRYQSVESRAVSATQVDAASTQARSSAALAEVARNRARAAEAQVRLSEANILTAKAEIEQNQAAVRQAELNLSYTKLIAPEDGHVARRSVERGSYLQPGQAVMAIVPHELWVVANFKETQLTKMRPGQPVEIALDAYPEHKLRGHVDSIQRGAGAKFSLFPPENATGNYVKVVQRVPVKIVFDEPPRGDVALGPGMSVEPKVRVE
jgi:membrane fusion protein (multidrug efflux system)